MAIRSFDLPYLGEPGSYTDADLLSLAGKFICCPGCTIVDFHLGRCHTCAIVAEFRTKFPDKEAPQWLSMATKTVEGRGGLRDVLVTKQAVFCGCRPPRAAPTMRELGVRFKATRFGNPEVMVRLRAGIQKGKETRAKKAARKEVVEGVDSEVESRPVA